MLAGGSSMTGGIPVIRSGAPGDAARLAVLGAQVWMHTYATEGVSAVIAAHVSAEFTEARFAALLSSDAHGVLVAESGRHLIGYAVLAWHAVCPSDPAARLELVTLHVQAHFARRGIGTALLRHSEREARCRTERIWLMVNAANDPAVAFYASQGYAKIGTAYFELGDEKHENHVLARGATSVENVNRGIA
ncbi:MAG: GNAT family N-acetyltransferase [Caldimonas sp.]